MVKRRGNCEMVTISFLTLYIFLPIAIVEKHCLPPPHLIRPILAAIYDLDCFIDA